MPNLAINGKEKLTNYNQQLNVKRNKKLPHKRYGFLSVCQPLILVPSDPQLSSVFCGILKCNNRDSRSGSQQLKRLHNTFTITPAGEGLHCIALVNIQSYIRVLIIKSTWILRYTVFWRAMMNFIKFLQSRITLVNLGRATDDNAMHIPTQCNNPMV